MNDICGWITRDRAGRRVRCTKPLDHRSPHWTETELIDCACTTSCHCDLQESA